MIKLDKIIKLSWNKLERESLNNVSFEVNQGEFFSVIGDNKDDLSNLLKIIGLIGDFDSGNYILNNVDVKSIPRNQFNLIKNSFFQYLHPSSNLKDSLSIYKNLESSFGKKFNNFAKSKKITEVLDQLNIIEQQELLPTELSRSDYCLALIAQAMLSEPDCILSDNMLSNLDFKSRERVLELFLKMRSKGTTIIMSSVNKSDAIFCDRAVEIDGGKKIVENILA